MDIRSILRDVSFRIYSIIDSVFSAENLPVREDDPRVLHDNYLPVSRNQILRDAFSVSSSEKEWQKQSPWLFSPWGLLSIAGCGGDDLNDGYGGSDSGDVPPDGGMKDPSQIDADGDGFYADIDCDDFNSKIIPLKNNDTVTVRQSVKICPGSYEKAKLFIGANTDSLPIEILAEGVSLNNATIGNSVLFDNVSNATLVGLNVFSSGSAIVRINGGEKNTVKNMVIGGEYGEGLVIDNSRYSKVLSTRFYGLYHDDGYISIRNGSDNSVENSTFEGTGLNHGVVISSSSNNHIRNNVMTGAFIYLSPTSGKNEVYRNTIKQVSEGSGVKVFGDENSITENISQNNPIGIFLDGNACGNTVKFNDVRFNSLYGIDGHDVCPNVISDNQE
ncbi:right-handed parallel beta-helix repeat-containing protein [Deltaproteobacteria bacterium PRO3]|nr:right-handed parallel beta-helix repeat-containing protein [Deltaproteobacteria bacterium PRO3]